MPINNVQYEEVILFLEQLAVRPGEDILYFMKRTTGVYERNVGTLRRHADTLEEILEDLHFNLG